MGKILLFKKRKRNVFASLQRNMPVRLALIAAAIGFWMWSSFALARWGIPAAFPLLGMDARNYAIIGAAIALYILPLAAFFLGAIASRRP